MRTQMFFVRYLMENYPTLPTPVVLVRQPLSLLWLEYADLNALSSTKEGSHPLLPRHFVTLIQSGVVVFMDHWYMAPYCSEVKICLGWMLGWLGVI